MRPDEFRGVARAHVIAWREDLVRRTLSGMALLHPLVALSPLGDHQAPQLLDAPPADDLKGKCDRAMLATPWVITRCAAKRCAGSATPTMPPPASTTTARPDRRDSPTFKVAYRKTERDGFIHESRAGFNSKDPYEIEADRFSAGFLMPRHLFFPALERAGKGLAAIEALALLCKTSLHATAIRYTQCTRDPMAVVISVGGRIDHCFMSTALKERPGIDWLRKREAVPRGTATHAFNQDASNVTRAVRMEESAQLQQWFGGNRHLEISEDVIGLGRYGKTLTVLYDIDLPEPEEEDDEAALIESWTPRFKR